MGYHIARDGKVYGPYTEAEVHQYLAIGNILPSDQARVEGAVDWVPVLTLFPHAQTSAGPRTALRGARYPDPPDLPWFVALILGVVTGGVFFVVWDIVQASWLRRVRPTSQALALYVGIAVLYLLKLPFSWGTINYNLFGGPPVGPHHGFLMFLVWLGLFIASRTVIRQELLQHFNVTEPIGLRLNAFLVYLLGGLYLQYQFNHINERKRALYVSVPAI